MKLSRKFFKGCWTRGKKILFQLPNQRRKLPEAGGYVLCKSAGIWWSCGGTAAQVGFLTFATQSFFFVFLNFLFFFNILCGRHLLGWVLQHLSQQADRHMFSSCATTKRWNAAQDCIIIIITKTHQNQQTHPLQRSQQTAFFSAFSRTQTFIITVNSGFLILTGFLLSLIKHWHWLFANLLLQSTARRRFFLLPASVWAYRSVFDSLSFHALLCFFVLSHNIIIFYWRSTASPNLTWNAHWTNRMQGQIRGRGSNARNVGNYLFPINCKWIIVHAWAK